MDQNRKFAEMNDIKPTEAEEELEYETGTDVPQHP
jgi:hypothetical protein